MNREDTILLLSILKSAYPRFYNGMNRSEADAIVNLWTFMFSEHSVEDVKVALYKIISTSTFPPSISEVKQVILNSKLNNKGSVSFVSSSFDAWESVLGAIRNFGYTKPFEALESLSDITRDVIKTMGGWKRICLSNNTNADRESFIRIYEQIEKKEYQQKLIDKNLLKIEKKD